MERLKAILVDDEWNSLQNLQHKLTEFCPDVEIIAALQTPEEAIQAIRDSQPDVIFLDIEMPRMNGFRLLNELNDIRSEIIFTTAYDHYAIEAIRVCAFDYLTKPIAIKDLQQAVERLVRKAQPQTKEKLDLLRTTLSHPRNQEEKIAIPTANGLEFIPVKSIIHIESHSNYSRLYLLEGKPLLVTRLLKDFEDMLQPYHFFRIHHSHLVNLSYIKKYIRGEGGQVVMQNGDVIDVARRKKEEFLRLLNT